MIFYIDPMSYNNLAIYDFNLLSNLDDEYIFYGNGLYSYKHIDIKKVFNYSSKKNKILKLLSYSISSIRIMFAILIKRPEKVHYQWFKVYKLDYVILKLLKYLSKCEIIHTAHNILPHDTGDKYKSIHSRIYHIVDKIIVHTEISKIEFGKLYPEIDPDKIFVIPHGLLDLSFNETYNHFSKSKVMRKYNLPKNKIIVSFLGFLSYYKGIDIFSETISEVNNEELYFLVAGNGKTIDTHIDSYLKEEERVTYINRYLEDNEFLELINVSDIIVLPYRDISQSGLLLTALNYNKLIMTSGVGGLSEPFNIGNVGWIVKSNEFQHYTVILNKINREMLTDFDKEEWNKLHKFYSWLDIAKKTKNCYWSS